MTKLGMGKEAVEPQVLYLLASSDFQKICELPDRSLLRFTWKTPTSQDVLSDKWQNESCQFQGWEKMRIKSLIKSVIKVICSRVV